MTLLNCYPVPTALIILFAAYIIVMAVGLGVIAAGIGLQATDLEKKIFLHPFKQDKTPEP